ncbi:tandem-95 repeat protein [uncultured Tateyamaria sp.]|uniref:tandem-95 repeat protein n=1 Tax=uncultured Tateyamaria sp. TaxID=455651 RepID=UPI002607D021|nr:tandem-95 repeat protein [uncultured Tateyamaria sp.]
MALKPKIGTSGKFEFEGTNIDNGGIFSKNSLDDFTDYKKTGPVSKAASTKFSEAYVAENNIKLIEGAGGGIEGDNVVKSLDYARDALNEKVGGAKISSFDKIPKRVLELITNNIDEAGKLGVFGLGITVGTLVALGASASTAQAAPTYDETQPVNENKELLAEIVAGVVSGLSGAVAAALAGVASFGLLTLPAAIAASIAGDVAGRAMANAFYALFPEAGNAAAEALAPLLASAASTAAGLANAAVNFVSDVFEYTKEKATDLVVGKDGLFGLEGPLFAEGKPLAFAREFLEDNNLLNEKGEWTFDGFDTIVEGDDEGNLVVHEGWGEARGNGGDDILVGFKPIYYEKGDALYEGDNSPIAEKEERLVLDGGAGDDWVVTIFGERAVTIGGNGRDWIFNTSYRGDIYGDTIDGQSPDGTDLEGSENSDNIWWYNQTTMWDPSPNDVLKFWGVPLVGGTNNLPLGLGQGGILDSAGGVTSFATMTSPLYFDYFLPFINYMQFSDGNMYVVNAFRNFFGSEDFATWGDDGPNLRGGMRFVDFESAATIWSAGFRNLEEGEVEGTTSLFGLVFAGSGFNPDAAGDMGMLFKNSNPFLDIYSWFPGFPGGINRALPLIEAVLTYAGAASLWGKAWEWVDGVDPLILDLDGDGIETIAMQRANVFFDFDGDFFAERTGWLDGDDGFLVLDENGNGLIDDISEMFGGVGASGFAELAAYDGNEDGVITIDDAIFAELRIWQDRNQNGVTDGGELKTLSELGIASIDAGGTDLPEGTETPQGTELHRVGEFAFEDGRTSKVYDAVFELDDVVTQFNGEVGQAAWLSDDSVLYARGFGNVINLDVAMSNDFALADIARTAAAAMTTPDLAELRAASADLLGQWSFVQNLTRELAPVLLDETNGQTTLQDRAIYVEDATGGYWTLESGAPVTDVDGIEIARPTLQDVMAHTAPAGQVWQLEQMFSPSDRGEPLQTREAAPYLAEVIEGRVVVRDYGAQSEDGTWSLASGAPVTDADGAVITNPTVADIAAMAPPAGQEWRIEEIGFNALAAVEVEAIGVNFIDGLVVDYTVEVTDADGSFYVWARNLDRALELQAKIGTAQDFNLRNFEIDFDTLDEVGSTDDSQFRVELLTPGQFNLATSMSGFDFRPEMLSASIAADTGVISYTISPERDTGVAGPDGYVSGINAMIELLDIVMDQYITASRAFAARIALQGGLSEFAQGIEYISGNDSFAPTTDQELIPLFEAIFEAMPDTYDAARDYLMDWNEILVQIYPDYRPNGSGNTGGATVAIDQNFILQNVIPVYETVSTPLDLRSVMFALSTDQSRLVDHDETATEVAGTSGVDYIYMTAGDQTYRGGRGEDVYFVGGDSGNDIIIDYDTGERDGLRFTAVLPDQVTAVRDGQDMVLTIEGRTDEIRIKDQFLGELNPILDNKRQDSGVDHISFADGTLWDRFQMALEVSRPTDANDVIIGSGSGDVLQGGLGNDVLRGGLGGDYYFFGIGDGQDVISDRIDFETSISQFGIGPLKGGLDFLFFREGITEQQTRLQRDGRSDDLQIFILDDQGNETGDSLYIEGQFSGIRDPLNGALGEFDESLDFDFVSPFMIERFVFDDGASLDFEQIMERVLANAKTDGDDVIYGMLNDNTLDGGAGDDFLSGEGGADTYIFGRGYGEDVVLDADYSLSVIGEKPTDTLQFRDDLRWSDFDFERDGAGDTLTLRVSGTGDAVIMTDFLSSALFVGYINRIENIAFGDGTIWSWDKLLQHYVDIAATDGDDTVYGFSVADSIDGGAGDDRLEGQGGNDVYVWARDTGSDTIFDSGGADRVELRGLNSADVTFGRTDLDLIITDNTTGNRLVLENQYVRAFVQAFAVEELIFDDRAITFTDLNPEDIDIIGTSGADTLRGSNFAETIDGGAGDDLLIGRDGGDTYKFDAGYGADVIVDVREQPSWDDRRFVPQIVDDTVAFGGDINRGNVEFTKDGNDLVITIADRPDSLRIRDQFAGTVSGVERFTFRNEPDLTISDVEELLQIEGGNRGDNLIEGVPDQPNTLDGRQGDDTLRGGTEGDSYAFGLDYDLDRIEEVADASGVIDRIVFGEAITSAQLILRRDGDDLLVDLGNGRDVLTIADGLTTSTIEEFNFADGTTLTGEQVRDLLLSGTDGDDQLTGFDGRADVLAGGAGSDALAGGTGDDTYRFGFGDGADSARDTGGIDQIAFGTGVGRGDVSFDQIEEDLLVTLDATGETLVILKGASSDAADWVENFVFEDGTELSLDAVRNEILQNQTNGGMDVLDATSFDVDFALIPGAGFDAVKMADDTSISFSAGDGVDRITPPETLTSAEIVFDDLTSQQAEVRITSLTGDDLTIGFPETGDQIILVGGRVSATLPTLRFADGVNWQRADVLAALIETQQTERADVVFGTALDDVIQGGQGDDDLRGGAGDDRFIFERGDGRDVITDISGTDVVEIRGYLASEMTVSLPVASADTYAFDPAARSELVLSFEGGRDEITLRFDGDLNGVETVVFGDGSTISRAELITQAIGKGTPFDDVMSGTDENETFEGGAGDDLLRGDGGDDTYIFRRGDGRDVINEAGSRLDVNTLVLPDHLPGEVRIITTDDNFTSDIIVLLGNGDQVTLENALSTFSARVTTIRFADGTEWGRNEIDNALENSVVDSVPRIVQGTDGDDVIEASPVAEILEGGDGYDVYNYTRGDGFDRINDLPDTREGNSLRLNGYTIDEAEYAQLSADKEDLIVRFAGTEDSIVIDNAFFSTSSSSTFSGGVTTRTIWRSIKELIFDDGTVTIDTIGEMLIAAQVSDGDDLIEMTGLFETVEGGLGNDVFQGDFRDDTLIFNRGDGHDIIRPSDSSGKGTLDIRGYLESEVTVTRDVYAERGYILTFEGTDDRIELRGDGRVGAGAIDEVLFAGGVRWSFSQLEARAVVTNGGANDGVATDGNDTLVGSNDLSETFEGGLGDDVIEPGYRSSRTDTIVYSRGDGVDFVSLGDTYAVRVGIEFTDINPSDVRLIQSPIATQGQYDPEDLIIEIIGTTDRIVVQEGTSGLRSIDFADGTYWSLSQIAAQTEIYPGPAGQVEVINVSPYEATVDAAAGDQSYFVENSEGYTGDVTFEYARGDGHDSFTSYSDFFFGGSDFGGSGNRIKLLDVASTEVSLWFLPPASVFDDGNDLMIDWGVSTDSLRIVAATSPFGGTSFREVEFSDGLILSLDQLIAQAEAAELADPRTYDGAFTFERGVQAGRYAPVPTTDDNGGGGPDLPIGPDDPFGPGGGAADADITLVGVLESELSVERRSDRLVLNIAERVADPSDGGQIWLAPEAELTGTTVTLDDGTVLTSSDLIALIPVVQATEGDDVLRADSFNPGGVTMEGLGGDDVLVSPFENTTFVYARGDGNDLITAEADPFDVENRLELSGIAPDAFSLVVQGPDLLIRIDESAPGAGDGSFIRFVNGYTIENIFDVESPTLERARLGEITFDDGTIWDAATIEGILSPDPSSDGNDIIEDAKGPGTYELGRGDDVVITDGYNDTYIYNNGDGNDVIDDSGSRFNSGNDVLQLPDFNTADVRFVRDADDLLVVIDANVDAGIEAGSLRMSDAYRSDADQNNLIDRIVFQDGSELAIGDVLQSVIDASITAGNDLTVGTDFDDQLAASAGDDVLEGGAGDDSYFWTHGDGDDIILESGIGNASDLDQLTLVGVDAANVSYELISEGLMLRIAESAPGAADGGSVLIQGMFVEADTPYNGLTPGGGIEALQIGDDAVLDLGALRTQILATLASPFDDKLTGSAGADTIEGGAGDDILSGLGGDDVYIWSRGDGADRILENSTTGSRDDRLELRGVDPGEVTLKGGFESDLEIIIADSSPGAGDGGRITARSSITTFTGRGIESIAFDDGTVWTRTEFADLAASNTATPGNDRITGTSGADTLDGLGGDDRLIGGDGADLYLYTRGGGADIIDDRLGVANSLQIAGYAAEDVTFTRRGIDGPDLIIRLTDLGDEITIVDGLVDGATAITSITLSDDGTTFDLSQIEEALVQAQSSDEADVIVGTVAADVLAGGTGTDLLAGGAGDDNYIFAKGDGDDRISDDGNDTGDVLRLDGLTPDDLAFALRAGADSLDLALVFVDGRDRIILEGALATGVDGVDRIIFADGTEWDRTEMRAQALGFAETARSESVHGFDGDDVFHGSAGADVMLGGVGADTYIMARGNGHDEIRELGGEGLFLDRVEFPDFVSSEVSVTRLFKGSDTIKLSFTSAPEDSLTIVDALAGNRAGIEQFAFSDGVTWTIATLEELLANNAPVAVADGYFTVTEGEAVTIAASTLLRNDFDADGDDLSIIAVDGGPNGMAELDQNGDVVFTPATEFFGPTQLTYTLSDGRNGLTTTTVDLRVRPIAEARDDTGFVMDEDGFLTIEAERLLSNDIDGDRLLIAQVFNAENGSVSLSSVGEVTFTPDQNFVGTGSFTYLANTPEGGSAEARVSIVVQGVNDAPDARNDVGFVTDEDNAFLIATSVLLGNDRDVDGDTFAITSVISNENVTAELTDDGFIVVTPRPFFFGEAYFDYVIADPDGLTDTARVEIEVTPVNDAPIPGEDVYSLLEDTPFIVNITDLLANDFDPDGDTLSLVQLRASSFFGDAFGGTAERLDNDTILFTPWADFDGTAFFGYVVDDGQGANAIGRVTINMEPVNDRPITGNDDVRDTAFSTLLRGTEDVPLEIPISALMQNDADVEGLALTFDNVSDAADGVVTITDYGTVIFTPDADFWGLTTFNYIVSDPEGAVADATVTLFFDNVGDAPPVVVNDSVSVFEDVVTIIPQEVLLSNDSDIDRDTLEITGFRLPGRFDFPADRLEGTIERNAAGDFVFTPDLNVTDVSGFFYTVSDGADGSTEGFVNIEIIPQNDQPTAVTDTVASTQLNVPLVVRIAEIMANDFDVDEEAVSFVGVDSASVGTATVEGDFIVLRVPEGFSGPIALTYRITDAAGFEDTALITAVVTDSYDLTLTGTPQDDLLIGNDLGETIIGLAGDDRIEANDGADLIDAGTGADTILAGAGDDLIAGGDDGDSIDGGEGIDTLTFEASDVGVRADLSTRVGQGGHAQGDIYTNLEALIGSEWNDTLGGDSADNLLEGRGGRDLLEGRDGADTVRGGAGDDVLVGGAGGDDLDGGVGRDAADYRSSEAAVTVSLANNTASGGDAAGDTLTSIEDLAGSDFDDALTGDDAGNILSGGRGADTLDGGAGDDILSGGRGADVLRGGAGIDTADYTLSVDGVQVDMADGSAGGGDATGDVFDSIEIVQGSFHDDTISGNDDDNILRGGRGADIMDGRDGFDTADYSTADEGIAVDLSTGLGTAGEALGDTLSNIEAVTGSVNNDTITGGAGDDLINGNWGDDRMAGAAGSDGYVFGYDSGTDLVIEAGDAGDIDRVVLMDDILPKDLSVIREGDDLLLELERDEGFLIDTLRVRDHFLGTETGIEEVVFADGTVWDRDQIDALQRLGRFNAADDVYRLAIEDEQEVIDPAFLIQNDVSGGTDGIALISVQNAVNGVVEILPDGQIGFVGDADFFGDAFFDYTLRDQFGRESTARVEVNVAPVNDAPEGVNDGVFAGVEDTILRIRISDLLANDMDIEGDALTLDDMTPLLDLDGQEIDPSPALPNDFPFNFSLTNAIGWINGDVIEIKPDDDHFGPAGLIYTLSDEDGLTSTAEVSLFFAAVNDAPRSGLDGETIRLERTAELSVDDLMRNDLDIEGDAFSITDVSDAFGGTLEYNAATGTILFTPDALGTAGFTYELTDARGAVATIPVELTVIPLNDAPDARDDGGFVTLEDQVLLIDPADLLANDTDDTDPLDEVLFISGLDRFAENGRVAFTVDGLIQFTPRSDYNGEAGFLYQVADGNGGFDEGYVSITILPSNRAPVLRDDVAQGDEDTVITVIPGEVFGNDLDPEGDVIFFESLDVLGALTEDFSQRDAFAADFGFDMDALTDTAVLTVTLDDGTDLPDGLTVDPDTLILSGTRTDGLTEAFTVTGTYTDGNTSHSWSLDVPTDADLAAGVSLTPELALFDISAGTFSVQTAAGRRLPSWLEFDPETLTLTQTDPVGADDTDLVRLQLRFDALEEAETETQVNFGRDGFAIEVVIDPQAPDLASLNALFANDPFFAAQGLYAVPVGGGQTLTAEMETGADLVEWLSFDAAALSFEGTPPPVFVGTPGVRIDATGGPRDFAIVTELPIDDVVTFATLDGVLTNLFDDRFLLGTPEDFTGQIALRYSAADEKGGVSAEDAIIVVNVFDQPETPDAGDDIIAATEDVAQTFALVDLLANDVDDDGDPIRVIDIAQPQNGTLSIALASLTLAVPTGLPVLSGGVYAATLADGSDLPAWLSINTATGDLSGDVPLDATGVLDLIVTVTDGVESFAEPLSTVLDGNDGVMLTYTPYAGYNGIDTLVYTITDDQQGTGQGRVTFEIAAVNDPPEAVTDMFDAFEDETLVLSVADLLANDTDVDGDALTLVSVDDAINGTVVLDGGEVRFTPDPNYAGPASFTYLINDGTGESATGTVTLNVISTNVAPVAATDTFDALEDTPLTISIADLLANDFDPDGDAFSFVSAFATAQEGEIFLLPGGELQFISRENLNGPVTLDYTISDGRLTDRGSIVVNIAAVNDAPILNPDAAILGTEDTALSITMADLLANDVDVEGDSFSVVSIASVDNGTATLNGGVVTFTPRADYFGDAGFEYVVEDSRGAQSTGYALITLNPENDLPFAITDNLSTNEDTPLEIDPALLVANDIDPDGDTLSVLSIFQTFAPGPFGPFAEVPLEQLENGNYLFTPDLNDFGETVLQYRIIDAGDQPVTGTIVIDMIPVPDDPIARDDAFDGVEDTPLSLLIGDLLANDDDPDFTGLTLTGVSNENGISVVNDGQGRLLITPDANRNGPTSFEYTIVDGDGVEARAEVTITFAAVNDAPDIAPIALTGTEDTAFAATLDPSLFTDVDGDAVSVDVRGVNGAALPAWLDFDLLTLTLSGTPPANFNGDVLLDVAAFDGKVETVQTVTLTIAPVNDAPTIAATMLEGVEDTVLDLVLDAALFADVDGDALSIDVQGPAGAARPDWIAFDPDTLRLTGTPPADFNGEIALELSAFDGTVTVVRPVTLTLVAVNDAPEAGDDSHDAGMDLVFTLRAADLLANDMDVEGDTLSIINVTGAQGVQAALDDAGDIVISRDRALEGEVTLTYTVSDGALSDTAAIVLNLTAANRAPQIAPISALQGIEDTALDVAFGADVATDPDGDALILSVTRASGTALPNWLQFDATERRLTGQPPADFFGTLALQLVATDGALSTTRDFELVIDPVNDAPILQAPLSDRTVQEDTPFSVTLQQNIYADVDGDTLSFALVNADGSALPDWISFDADTLTLTGQAPADFAGTYGLRLLISDGQIEISDDFDLVVLGSNDAPVITTPLADIDTDDAGAPLVTGTPFEVSIDLSGFEDPDGDDLTFAVRLADGSDLPAWLQVSQAGLTGTAPADAAGTLSIAVQATDGTFSVEDSFDLTFAPGANVGPVANDDSFTTAVQDTLRIDAAALLANDTDGDGDALTVIDVAYTGPGTVGLENGVVSYLAGFDFEGTDQFTYTVSDGTNTDTATVSIEVSNDFDDAQDGGQGTDLLFGGRGDDLLSGGSGGDLLFGGRGDDFVSGGSGRDVLFGGSGADTIDGGQDRDTIFGGSGDDVIRGGAGRDALFGGRGSDRFEFGTGDGRDTIYDFEVSRATRRSFIEGDEIALRVEGIESFDDLLGSARETGGGVLFDFGDGDQLFLAGTQLAALDDDQFSFY